MIFPPQLPFNGSSFRFISLNAEVSDFNTRGNCHRNVTVRVLATVIVLINVVTVQ